MDKLDIAPCYIKIFDKYDNCRRFKNNQVGKPKGELDGYFAISYLCYYKALKRFPDIEKNLNKQIKTFYEKMGSDIGNI